MYFPPVCIQKTICLLIMGEVLHVGGWGDLGNLSIFHFILLELKKLLKHKVCFLKNIIYRVMPSGTCFKVRQTLIYWLFDLSLTYSKPSFLICKMRAIIPSILRIKWENVCVPLTQFLAQSSHSINLTSTVEIYFTSRTKLLFAFMSHDPANFLVAMVVS